MDIKAKSRAIFSCLFIAIVVFVFFSHTLNYSWKLYDEETIFKQLMLPIPKSFSEIFEIVSLFGINNHFEASNPFYSNISNIRNLNFGTIFNLLIFWLLKDSSLKYHLFMLIMHLSNSCLGFLILHKTLSDSFKDLSKNVLSIISLLFILMWALHPVNVESVLFATNFGALVTYFFCLLIFLYYVRLNKLQNSDNILLFITYLFPLFLHEYSAILPVIIFVYLFTKLSVQNPKTAFLITLKALLPLLIGLAIYIVSLSIFSIHLGFSNRFDIQLTTERIFWLSPQILFHFIKLIIYPTNLSIDQTVLVKLANNLFEPYTIFCSLFMFLLVFLILISFLLIKHSKFYYYLLIFSLFLFSLIPFLHIVSPAYNLASERYLYLPSFFFIFGTAHICSELMLWFARHNLKLYKSIFLVGLLTITLTAGKKAYLRTLDWKDSFTLFSSAIKVSPNRLFKALREQMIVRAAKVLGEVESKEAYKTHSQKAIKHINRAYIEFENKKIKYQRSIPKIIEFYGLDPQTQLGKCAFLNALIELDLNGNPKTALEIFEPYTKYFNHFNTDILSFYYRVLFNTNNIDKAEKILKQSLEQNTISPVIFVALSDITEYKYKDYKQVETYLLNSLKYFPYDTNTLYGLKRLYSKLDNTERFTHFSYLFGLRTHSQTSLTEALIGYLALNNKQKSQKILNVLLSNYPITQETLQLKKIFENRFSNS